MPTTFGTATFAGPADTTSTTAVPLATVTPAAGTWLITSPAATVALDTADTAPPLRPGFVTALSAAACVRPTTFGTVTCGGPDDTTNATPVFSAAPGAPHRVWLITGAR